MDFYDYMERYRGEDSPMGDLAVDMARDDGWPRFKGAPTPKDKDAALLYLARRHACYECVETFKTAWRRYMGFAKRSEKAS